jgi:hypothetical protein
MTPDDGPAPDGWGEPRSRTVTWWDPMIGAHAMHDLSGRDYLQAMIDGRLPPAPIGGLMAMTAVSVGEGTVEFRCRPDESAYNPIGVVHGGLVCTLLDSVAGCAVHIVRCTARCRREWATRVWRSRSATCARSGMVEAS